MDYSLLAVSLSGIMLAGSRMQFLKMWTCSRNLIATFEFDFPSIRGMKQFAIQETCPPIGLLKVYTVNFPVITGLITSLFLKASVLCLVTSLEALIGREALAGRSITRKLREYSLSIT